MWSCLLSLPLLNALFLLLRSAPPLPLQRWLILLSEANSICISHPKPLDSSWILSLILSALSLIFFKFFPSSLLLPLSLKTCAYFCSKTKLNRTKSLSYPHFFLNVHLPISCLPFSPIVLKEPILSTFILPLAPAFSPTKSLSWRSVTYQLPNPMVFLQHLMVKQTFLSFLRPENFLFPLCLSWPLLLYLLTSSSPLLHTYKLHVPTSFQLVFMPPKFSMMQKDAKTQDNQGHVEIEKIHLKIIMGTPYGECKTGYVCYEATSLLKNRHTPQTQRVIHCPLSPGMLLWKQFRITEHMISFDHYGKLIITSACTKAGGRVSSLINLCISCSS